MEYRTLGKTGLKVSRMGFGGIPIQKIDAEGTKRLIHELIKEGVNYIDTARGYTVSEEYLGYALEGVRDSFILATKSMARTKEAMAKDIEISLKNLHTDYIDLYQVHYRDGVTPLADVAESLEILKQQGKIRYYGLSNIHEQDAEELKAFGNNNPFVSFQDEYSLACRKNETEMFRFRDEYAMTPFTWGSLGQGILSGKYDKNCKFEANDRRSRDIYVNFHGEKLLKNLEIVEVLKEIAADQGKSVASVAIRWILDYLQDSVVIVGAKSSKQVLQNAEALDWTFTQEQIDRLDKISKE